MTKSFVIWGCSGHAKVLACLIDAQGGRIVAFFDNQDVQSVLTGVPVYCGVQGFHTWLAGTKNVSNLFGLVAIGGSRGADRIAIQHIFRQAGLTVAPIIHPAAYVSKTASLGDGTQILAHAVVAADAHLGDSCIVNHKASVDHECNVGDGVHIAPGATVCGCVSIADNVFVGAGAVILPRLKIGSGAVIGAGAVVTKNVSANATIVGNPGVSLFKKQ